ncbi:hypothetical protein BCF33_0265 [Hasllibacter halocynthiae]|uniref:CENP-V/GFA domain-containing protein n=2 Tax=Hasllibacter halocynthiae TaxID=595589 RepID=A0A2T0X6T9_9RHOB|nr:hypothetical protein BCF33_0265 [Hasllibacter halocynthiae]
MPFSCRCGAVRGTLDPSDGVHLRCFCQSCRGAARLAGAADPGADGVALFQTTPDRLTFAAGRDLIEPLRFSPRSFVRRWRTRCCGDVLFSSGDSPRWPVAGPVDRVLADPEALGPEQARAFLPPRRAGGLRRHEGAGYLIAQFARRTAAARFRRAWRNDPLMEADGRYPKARPATPEEVSAAFPEGPPLPPYDAPPR